MGFANAKILRTVSNASRAQTSLRVGLTPLATDASQALLCDHKCEVADHQLSSAREVPRTDAGVGTQAFGTDPLAGSRERGPTRLPALPRPAIPTYIPETVKLNPTWPRMQKQGNSFIQKKSEEQPWTARRRGAPPAGVSRGRLLHVCCAACSRTFRRRTLANSHTLGGGALGVIAKGSCVHRPSAETSASPHPGARRRTFLSAELLEWNLAFDHNCYFSFS